MNEIIDKNIFLLELISNKNTKVLFQNPGRTSVIKYVLNILDVGLQDKIKVEYKRNNYIRKNMIYIVNKDKIDCIWIRGCINDENRVYSQEDTNVAYNNPETFNYWNLPEKTFDILVSKNPVRLEMMKDDFVLFDSSQYLYL